MDFLKRLWARLSGADREEWKIVTAENPAKGEAAVFRVRMSKPTRPDLRLLTTAIMIRWPYNSRRMPPPGVNQQQLDFEEALDELSGGNDNSELVQVTTGMGLKEWVYYARNREDFMARLNQLLTGHPPYPLQIEFYDDPKWELWSDAVARLRARGA